MKKLLISALASLFLLACLAAQAPQNIPDESRIEAL
jgi:hypothetical protein